MIPGLANSANGMAVAARLIANEQGAELIDAQQFAEGEGDVLQYDEVWVHSAWLPVVSLACRRVLKAGKRLVRIPHANYDPLRLAYHGWKKMLVGPIERFCLRRASVLVATCEAERGWILGYLGKRCPPVVVCDIKRFFKLPQGDVQDGLGVPLHLLYLGRKHLLKGLDVLQVALEQLQGVVPFEFRAVSNAFGKEKEKVWAWCDVLVLPTLSENFGLVVAEALERGKRVITTDGAPAWGNGNSYGGRLTYLRGYREGSPAERVALLKGAIKGLLTQAR